MTQINLKNYIKEHGLCSTLQTGIRLNGQGSFVNFQFDAGVAKYTIEFVALRGADHSIIINGTPHLLKPNASTFIDVRFNNVNIKRSGKACGHIIVSRVFDDKQIIQTDNEINNLYDSFLKISKLKGVHVLKGIHKTDLGLFAKELAEIENEKLILSLETDPYNSYIRKNNKIIFIYPCRILATNIVKNIVEVQPEPTKFEEQDFVIDSVVQDCVQDYVQDCVQDYVVQDYNIKNLLDNFAILDVCNNNTNNTLSINGVFELSDFKSKLWYSRCANFFSNIGYTFKNGIAFNNANKSKFEPDIQLNDIENVFEPSKRLFIHPCINGFKFNEKQISILKSCEKIFTPSYVDFFNLKPIISNVSLGYLPWPYVDGKYNTKDYYIYFEECPELTNVLVNCWDGEKKLYIVGSQNRLPNKFNRIFNFEKYEVLCKYILESLGVIYLSRNVHHISGLIELAINCKIPVLTNNHHYIKNETIVRNVAGGICNGDLLQSLNVLFSRRPQLTYNNNYNDMVVLSLENILRQ